MASPTKAGDDRGLHGADSKQRTSPQLLVSVRDAVEAAAALQGDCDLLDVEDPTRGSLGMAPVSMRF